MNQHYIVEYGLEGRVKYAVNGANTVEDLTQYLTKNKHYKSYRLVTCQFLDTGNFLLVWEKRK